MTGPTCSAASCWTACASGRGAVVRNAILDKNVVVPEDTLIGVDHDEDRRRGFAVSEGGITVLGKGQTVPG